MRAFLRTLGVSFLLGMMVAGCSTPGKRAREHAAAFHRLAAPDRKIVLGGHVRPGLSQEGVYIAWGEPDEKHAGDASKDGQGEETWVYRHRITLYNPMWSYDHFGPSHGYGDLPREPWLRPGYGSGGIGNEGSLQYRPNVRNLDTLRIAVFKGAKVDGYKEAGGKWTRPARSVVEKKASAPSVAKKKAAPPEKKQSKKSTGGKAKGSQHHPPQGKKAHPSKAHGKTTPRAH